MATTSIPDAVADFVASLKSVSDYEWNEAEELLGDKREDIKAAVSRASSKVLGDPGRARGFDQSLGLTTKALSIANFPAETVDLLVKTVVLAIYSADQIDETDYDTLVRPMRAAWADIPQWSDLQPTRD